MDQDRAALRRALDDADVQGEERLRRLMEFAEVSRTCNYPLGSLYQFGRPEETLITAGLPEYVVDALDLEQCQTIAAQLWGFSLNPAGKTE